MTQASLSSNKRHFLRASFLTNAAFEDAVIITGRRAAFIRGRCLFHCFLPKRGVYNRAAFKRGNTVLSLNLIENKGTFRVSPKTVWRDSKIISSSEISGNYFRLPTNSLSRNTSRTCWIAAIPGTTFQGYWPTKSGDLAHLP